MVRNYFKIAVRNLLRHKAYSFVNISGLAIGMACCFLILLFVKEEVSYDRFHEKADRIYRVVTDFREKGQAQRFTVTSPPIAPALKSDFPEVEQAVRVSQSYSKVLVKRGEKSFYEKQFYYADPNLFDIFSFRLTRGFAATALAEPQTVVISRKAAETYFGDEDPTGKTLSIEVRHAVTEYKVTGVLEDIPENSHLRPEFIIPFSNLGHGRLDEWWDFGFFTYVLLTDPAGASEFEAKLPAFMKRRMPPSDINDPLPELSLQPLMDVHLHSDFGNREGEMSQMTYVYLFSVLALFIILIACINFMNLSTARSHTRAKEVGVRKVVGAARLQLIRQFLSESFVMAFLSLLMAAVLVELFLPIFNALAGKTLSVDYAGDATAALGFIGITVLVGFVSGSYPAFFLSRFKPIQVLKSQSIAGGGAGLRKTLVVMQFAISVGLIFGTMVVFSQLEFVKNKELGFDKESLISVPLESKALQNSAESFKAEVLRDPNVVDASLASVFPFGENWWRTGVRPEGTNGDDRKHVFTFQIDFRYFRTLGASLIAGRDFSHNFSLDSGVFIINETAVKEFGWESPAAAVGKTLAWLGHGPEHPKVGSVIGVVRDFHYRSLHEKIEPAVFHIMPEPYEFLTVRIRPDRTSRVLETVRKVWTSIDPNHPVEYSFLDDQSQKSYATDEKLGKIFGLFSGLAIFIACLGLYGLAAFTAERRTKEIGIRKVLGATVTGIIRLLTRDLVRLVFWSNVIAWPLAYWGMNKWLENFAYRTQIGVQDFLAPAVIALVIALITVTYQAIKAATANPVEALKYE